MSPLLSTTNTGDLRCELSGKIDKQWTPEANYAICGFKWLLHLRKNITSILCFNFALARQDPDFMTALVRSCYAGLKRLWSFNIIQPLSEIPFLASGILKNGGMKIAKCRYILMYNQFSTMAYVANRLVLSWEYLIGSNEQPWHTSGNLSLIYKSGNRRGSFLIWMVGSNDSGNRQLWTWPLENPGPWTFLEDPSRNSPKLRCQSLSLKFNIPQFARNMGCWSCFYLISWCVMHFVWSSSFKNWLQTCPQSACPTPC